MAVLENIDGMEGGIDLTLVGLSESQLRSGIQVVSENLDLKQQQLNGLNPKTYLTPRDYNLEVKRMQGQITELREQREGYKIVLRSRGLEE